MNKTKVNYYRHSVKREYNNCVVVYQLDNSSNVNCCLLLSVFVVHELIVTDL